MEDLLFEKEGGIAIITLNRPERLNALSRPMHESMREAFKDAALDGNIRVVILTGAGRGFCAGADVQAGEAARADGRPPAQASYAERQWSSLEPTSTYQILAVMRSLPKPIICALNGVAAGAGTALALHCDVIIASDRAQYRVAFTRLGLTLEYGTSWLLPRRVGTHHALALAFTNDLIDAKEMERVGLVNKVVPHDELMKNVKELAKRMFQIPPLTLAGVKECVYEGIAAPAIEPHITFETRITRRLQETEDAKEARASFMQKREPVYKGK